MSVEHQQGTWTQLRLIEAEGGHVRHGASGDGGTESKACEEGQAITASTRKRALTDDLMGRVCEKDSTAYLKGMSRYNRRRNRRVRTRTHGGVGGRGPRGPLLPDWSGGASVLSDPDLHRPGASVGPGIVWDSSELGGPAVAAQF